MNYNALFPFEKIRDGQRELLEDVQNAIENRKILIAHAPAGIGKTAASLVPSIDYALHNDKRVFFLTSKQSQHKIAVDTLRLILDRFIKDESFSVVDVISKQDMCPLPISREKSAIFNEMCTIYQKTHGCSYFRRRNDGVLSEISENILHVEELVRLCKSYGMCPHRTALDAASGSDVMVCDYNYIFSDLAETILQRIGCSLDEIILIVDEAHNLPDRIRGNLSNELSLRTLQEAEKEIRVIDERLYRHLRGIRNFFEEMARTHNDEINVEKSLFVDRVRDILRSGLKPIGYEEFIEELKEVDLDAEEKRNLMSVAGFIDGWTTTGECARIFVCNKEKGNPTLSFKLLDPSTLSRGILSDVHSAIMMSGTLYPMEMYAEVLGAPEKRTILREYDSPFPKRNRLILITEGLTTKYTERTKKMYRRMAMRISEIAKETEGNVAVFFTSYELMDNVVSYVSCRNKIVERRGMNKGERNELYNKLRDEGGVLFGVQAGSLSEGLDYAHNLLSAVIVVGLPLPPPTLEVKNTIGYYRKKFGKRKGECYGYIYPAMNRALQAAGRGIRSESDVCAIILMDYRFQFNPYKDCFPSSYDINVTSIPGEAVKHFFARFN